MNKRLGAALLILAVTGCASYQSAHDDTPGIQLARHACPDEPRRLGTTRSPSWSYSSVHMANLASPGDSSMRSALTPATSPLMFWHRATPVACLD
ncbi:hypothetical protein MHM84_08280 [Halomonas sp. McH1-25]|nr:hypothetical protein [Halomonas sp. McH1-25]MCP1367222.1 hypothetical protein [Halomonas sp. BBD48]